MTRRSLSGESEALLHRIHSGATSKRGNGLLGIDISKIKDFNGNTTERCGRLPAGYSFYLWNNDNGYENIGDWIEKAAKDAGK
jgi:hypothetical protein